jgi:hypothetical protein
MLNERLNVFGVLGCALCIVGSCVIVLHAPPEREVGSLLEIWRLAMQPGARRSVMSASSEQLCGRIRTSSENVWHLSLGQQRRVVDIAFELEWPALRGPRAMLRCHISTKQQAHGAVHTYVAPGLLLAHVHVAVSTHCAALCRPRLRCHLRRIPDVRGCRMHGDVFAHFPGGASSWDIQHLCVCRHLFSCRILVSRQLQGAYQLTAIMMISTYQQGRFRPMHAADRPPMH